MNSYSAEARNSDLDCVVIKTATRMLACLGNYGYPVNFTHMARDGRGDYASFRVDVAHLPPWVSINHLRHPRLLAMMELCLRREVTVTNGRGKVEYIVALGNGHKPVQ